MRNIVRSYTASTTIPFPDSQAAPSVGRRLLILVLFFLLPAGALGAPAFGQSRVECAPDVNFDNAVDADDALVLYYAYSLKPVLGTGRGGGEATQDTAPVDPEVSIAAGAPLVPEGSPAVFVLTVSETRQTTFAVEVMVAVDGDFEVETGSRRVEFEVCDRRVSLSVETRNDDVFEATGTVTVTVMDGTGYEVGASSTASVAIADNDVLISIAASSSPVVEGEPAWFVLSASEEPLTAFTVEVAIDAAGGDFEVATGTRLVTFGVGQRTAAVRVDSEGDELDEADGTVTAMVVDGFGYTVGEPVTDSVTIADDDVTISIAPDGPIVVEGTQAVFLLRASKAPLKAFTAHVTVMETGDFGTATGTHPVAFEAGTPTATLRVETGDDNNFEAFGAVTATVEPRVGYAVGEPSTASVEIADDDIVISIAAVAQQVVEGVPALFLLTASEVPLRDFTVEVVLSATGEFGVTAGPQTVPFTKGVATAALPVATLGDSDVEVHGTVTATVRGGFDYTVGSPSSVKVAIADDDVLISIAAGMSLVVEGNQAAFILTASEEPLSAFTVNVSLAPTGDFGVTPGTTRTVPFEANQRTATLRVNTLGDEVPEPLGTLMATVEAGFGYAVEETATTSVTIADGIGLRIAAGASPVVEGNPASFVLTASEAPQMPLAVNVTVGATGDFGVATGTRPVTFEADRLTATLNVETMPDGTVEASGTVTATIADGMGYVALAPDTTAEVTIVDDDVVMSIAARAPTVVEGEPVKFIVTASEAPRMALTVEVELASSGGDFEVTTDPETVVLEAGATTTTLNVDTVEDDMDEESGTVTATLQAGLGYTLGDSDTASVTVVDDDGGFFRECDDCPEMVVVPSGTFTMGSPDDDERGQPDERPRHAVAIARFAVGRYEVTFDEWDACHKAYDDTDGAEGCALNAEDPRAWGRGAQPVVDVSWNDAQQYVAWLSQRTGETYRLLSESEWEYAARAGTQTAWHWGDDVDGDNSGKANCDGCGGDWDPPSEGRRRPAPVGSYPPNPFGLYDMSGNVWEWVQDCAYGNYRGAPVDGRAREHEDGRTCFSRVYRGGSYFNPPRWVRSANRAWRAPHYDEVDLGFRVARSMAVTVVDEDVTLSMLAGPSPVVEGSPAVFVLSTSEAPLTAFTVNVELETEGDFGVDTRPRTVMFEAGRTTASLSVDTMDDKAVEAHGTVMATLRDGAGYTVGELDTASVEIADDDVAISIATDASPVVEGEPATFTLTASEAPKTRFGVNVELAWTGDFGVATPTRMVMFEVGDLTVTLRVDTEGDEAVETWGTVTATVERGLGYGVGATSTAEVEIADDDVAISIMADASPVTEGESAMFTLAASEAPKTRFTVNVTLGAEGDFGVVTEPPRRVEFGVDELTATLRVETQGDPDVEPHGTVTATVERGFGYIAGASSTAQVEIADDDVRISIAADTSTVTEGESAMFTLTASEAPRTAFTVNVSLAEMGDFGVVTDPPRQVEFGEGALTATLSVDTGEDGAVEAWGTVTAMVEGGFGYMAGATSTASVTIADNDVLISVAPEAPTVAEGSPAVFVLTASEAPKTAFTVEVGFNATGDFEVATAPQSATFGDGVLTATLSVDTQGDSVVEAHGTVTATAQPGFGYTPGASAEVEIADDDIAISIEAETSPVLEDSPAIFVLTASEAPKSVFTVNVSLATMGDFGVVTDRPRRVEFGEGELTATLRVDTEGDTDVEAWGTVTATVEGGFGYVPGTPGTASVAIADDDVAISIVAGAPQVTEGNPAVFLLTASESPPTALTVEVVLEATGDFGVATGTRTVTFAVGQLTAGLPVTTRGDNAVEAHGTITATVRDGFDYTVGTPSTASVEIADDDVALSIAARAPIVVEGSQAQFVLTASEPPKTAFTVNVVIGATGAFEVEPGDRTMRFEANEPTATLRVNTRGDNAVEEFGTVTATLQSGFGYTVGATSTAEVEIADDDVTLSIEPGASPVTEDAQAAFIVRASEAPRTVLTVNVIINAEGDFGVATGTDSFVLGVGEETYTLRVNTGDDDLDEPDGAVTATLLRGFGYKVGTEDTASVEIADDDVAFSIEAQSSPVVEGNPAMFVLTANETLLAALTVEVVVAATGDFGVATGTHPVEFEANETTATLRVETEGDGEVEAHGTVTATLLDKVGYAVGTPASASVTVTDDDVAVSIATSTSSVTEGARAHFLLIASEAPKTAFTVRVALAVTGDFGVATDTPRPVVFGVGVSTTTLPVETEGDDVDEPDGTLTAEIEAGTGYTVGTPSTVSMTIEDDDVTITIATSTSSVLEGGQAQFLLIANEAPPATLTVNVALQATGDFDVVTNPRMIEFKAGATTTAFRVETKGDELDEPDGTLTATLRPGAGYTVGAPSTVSMAIADDDVTISIVASSSLAVEGSPAWFVLVANDVPLTAFTVQVALEEMGDFGVDTDLRAIPFEAGEVRVAFSVETRGDEAPEEAGTVIATVQDDPGYAVAEPLTASVTIADDDGGGFRDCAGCPEMVVLPGGVFAMGSLPTPQQSDEVPRHDVTITRFAVGRHEVTFNEWNACFLAGACFRVPEDPLNWGRETRPVINVSWEDAQEYVRWLSEETGATYRLLTESEWEYAARASSTTAYHWGDDAESGNANCSDCDSKWGGDQTAPVGRFPANAFGLRDMSGNVWEWVEDCWHDDYTGAPVDGRAWEGDDEGDCDRRVLRGGAWNLDSEFARSANRFDRPVETRIGNNIGLRVARTLD